MAKIKADSKHIDEMERVRKAKNELKRFELNFHKELVFVIVA